MTEDLKTAIAEAIKRVRNESWDEATTVDLTQAALQAIHDAGYVVVPRHPNSPMRLAGWANLEPDDGISTITDVWSAMIQAASQPKTEDEPK